MLGAIIGDIVGSVYEWNNIKTNDFPLFRDDCFFTDDTVMTTATADALMKGGQPDDFIDSYKNGVSVIPMRVMAAGSVVGFFLMTVSRITVGETVRRCEFHHVHGLWIAVSVPVQVCGLQTAGKEQNYLPK